MTAIIQVDAFTAERFRGNPAAVCLLEDPHDAAWMQLVAREMNLSATAFVQRGERASSLRWFTPVREIDLCGHGTLAAAHVLWERGLIRPDERAVFDTRSGRVTASRSTESSAGASATEGWIQLDFPATPDEEVGTPTGLAEALGAAPRYTGRSRFDYLVELEDEQAVRNLRPDLAKLRGFAVRGFIVTALGASPGVDFVSRYFAPAFGIDEDPVTGSAHCCLGPYWARRLNRTSFTAHQLSARGGVVKVELTGDRAYVAGQAITILAGELTESAG